jgi:hypothetical protein
LKFLSYGELREHDVPFTSKHLRELIAQNKFPKPVELGPNTKRFLLHEIEQWKRDRIAERDAGEMCGDQTTVGTQRFTPEPTDHQQCL